MLQYDSYIIILMLQYHSFFSLMGCGLEGISRIKSWQTAGDVQNEAIAARDAAFFLGGFVSFDTPHTKPT